MRKEVKGKSIEENKMKAKVKLVNLIFIISYVKFPELGHRFDSLKFS